jgi:Bacterial sugar transferase
VLRSEMSLVGPRPLLMEYLPRYWAEQMRRHDVLPGHYWIRANQWAQRGKLAAQVRVGCLGRGSLVDVAGPENYRGSSVKGPPTRRNQFIAPRLVRTVHGQRRGRTEQCTYD